MPTYTFRCLDCDKDQDVFQSITMSNEPPESCETEDCQSEKGWQKMVAGQGSFILKGTGWARDRYRG